MFNLFHLNILADITNIIDQKPSSTKEGKCLRHCIMEHFKVVGSYTNNTLNPNCQLFICLFLY